MSLDSEDEARKHDPISCEDCGEVVVVTRDQDKERADERVQFECACSVGYIGATKPDSWTERRFL